MHTIERICSVCRKLQPITQMTRVVRVGGCFYVQESKRLSGRGAHVCLSCLNNPNLQKCLARSFKMQIPDYIIQQLSARKGN